MQSRLHKCSDGTVHGPGLSTRIIWLWALATESRDVPILDVRSLDSYLGTATVVQPASNDVSAI
jgi:hypothetical protein